ncbi:UTP-glucose-1-phosphate uridylyltransferase [Candidatus Arthromitus sp. SFB-mouse-Japan]|uniref:UTP--glucose-1-phosphate uridylyltransferase GalU n=1 Tax=Candidatus Arthromitus sp. SFB-mouse TaxID=49118 RepID=UPI00021B8032|nr:UTP--glucose-1-phosphate uridylyltransferase GalU [Candidatus Arthromitus sp. SFB-mouse]EIA24788.1 UTP-glucose-1-phosphate uridylyltransferase [Candidatus Arthromitus sp. SFB-1]EIA24838.1 UTP-glucose-1-phosphate uridylyltransferase [Candidatus Arthromitus sp. SFB-2]EIA26322.1 UTP-glucose-1-phosphate uridylyltransferase [Candidatus Arthromitus sp. SFB-3]EIA26805.1 UTP-glucose-1-phosphate uridylyltransferase [Candidatus Arthromitus sp. SFB-4]EIA28493.1 UTP-glucose-1-phosphate uridylyltransfer
MSLIKKAVIPIAGFGTRFLPITKSVPKEMIPILDKPTIHYIVEEAVNSGITDILFVTSKHKKCIEDYFDNFKELENVLELSGNYEMLNIIKDISNMANISFVRQKEQKGLGHAIYHAKAFVGSDPFCVLLGDDLIYNDNKPCLKQLIDIHDDYGGSVIGVQKVDFKDVDKYGIIDGVEVYKDLYEVKNLIEKPHVDHAPSNIAILGRYIISPSIFEFLEEGLVGKGGEIQLTDSILKLLTNEKVYAYDFEGIRYDIGNKLGYLEATIDYALRDNSINRDLTRYLKER